MYSRLCIAIFLAALVFLGSASADTLLNANSASAEQLAKIKVLSKEAAAVIAKDAPFTTIGTLNTALSALMSAEELETLYALMFIPIKLNTASRKDMLLIPGLGPRMAHEFEEYRPYTSMEQFRREIGKYVDNAEVARLEMYVTLE